jgi:calcineurin-like phosphoesterase family protein
MNYYFISDTHFYHGNIIRYCNRPFSTVNEMNSTIVKNINKEVKEDDILIHGGDFAFGHNSSIDNIEYIRQFIVCKNIILVCGNHDKIILRSKILKNLFTETLNYFLREINGSKILVTHKPIYENQVCWERTLLKREYELNNSVIHLYGHVHNNSHLGPRNLCVENNDYSPISFERILERTKNANIPSLS